VIGVFGGTFDPPHIGHLILADEALGCLKLEKVLWVVTGEPPHKPNQPITAVEHRLDMVRIAIQGNGGFELSRHEVDRPGPHYAADTLALLTEEQPDSEWAYVMGKDSLRDLPQWHAPEQLVQLSARLVVLNRPEVYVEIDGLDELVEGLSEKVEYLEVPLVDVSSRDIRQRARAGEPYRYLVPSGIADYITEHELYT
jgi:nicotinate-nucleotide adenylyltransferase